jgi:tetratricopeptide (TPR) repeat protein
VARAAGGERVLSEAMQSAVSACQLQQLGQADQARAALQRACELEPATPLYRMELVRLLLAQGNASDAVQLLRPLLQGETPNAEFLFALAECARKNAGRELLTPVLGVCQGLFSAELLRRVVRHSQEGGEDPFSHAVRSVLFPAMATYNLRPIDRVAYHVAFDSPTPGERDFTLHDLPLGEGAAPSESLFAVV